MRKHCNERWVHEDEHVLSSVVCELPNGHRSDHHHEAAWGTVTWKNELPYMNQLSLFEEEQP